VPSRPKWLLVLVPLSVGCAADNETIRAEDSDTLFAGANISWEIDETPPSGEKESRTRTSAELQVSGSRSSAEQSLAAGQSLEIGGTLFFGPTDIDIDLDMLRVLVDVRRSWRDKHRLGFDALIGLGYSRVDVTLETSGLRGSDSFKGLGPLLGAALVYEPASWLKLVAEGSLNPTLVADMEDWVDINTLDLGLSWRLHEHASLRTSWRRIRYKADEGQLGSDLDLTLSGPALVLDLSW